MVLGFAIAAVGVMVIGSAAIALNHRAARARLALEESAALELVSLAQAREGGQIAIRGVVRNPAAGEALNGVSAVVLLFDRRDTFLGARVCALGKGLLSPGTESPFEVVLPDEGMVARYRVSFRSGLHPLPHLDRRGAGGVPPAKPGPSSPAVRTARIGLSSH